MDKQHFHSQTVTTQLGNNRLDHRGGLIIGLILVWGGLQVCKSREECPDV